MSINDNQVVYSDMDINLQMNRMSKDIIKKKNLEDIRQSIKLLLYTRYYDRKWHPEVGSYFPDSLFMQNDNMSRIIITDSVKELLYTFEPRINDIIVMDETTDEDMAKGTYRIRIHYDVPALNTQDTYIFVGGINR